MASEISGKKTGADVIIIRTPSDFNLVLVYCSTFVKSSIISLISVDAQQKLSTSYFTALST